MLQQPEGVDLEQWCQDTINGGGGFVSYLQHEEGDVFEAIEEVTGEPDERRELMVKTARWVLRCLTQPAARSVLDVVVAESTKRCVAERERTRNR